jgi:hypothetical protein
MFQHPRTTRVHRAFCAGLAFAVFFIGGCGGDRGPERVAVSGTITHKGQPIANGRIRFVPDADSHVPPTTASIVNGQYRADLRGGVPVGRHKVEIEAYRRLPDAAPDPLWVPDNYLPRRHGVDSQVWITIESGSREITKDFDLTD